MSSESFIDETIALGAEVAEVLRGHGVEPLLIGAVAMATHQYPRQTEDLDLAIAVSVPKLKELAASLESPGATVELREPDADDPLGGVVVVRRGDAFPVEVVNFDNSPTGGFPALVRDALERASEPRPELPFHVVDVGDLIIFKLYAGGPKSHYDVLELIARNQIDFDDLRERCRRYRMERELESVLAHASTR